jgi:hypothetical protein
MREVDRRRSSEAAQEFVTTCGFPTFMEAYSAYRGN